MTQDNFSKLKGNIDFFDQAANLLNQGVNAGVSVTQKANESTLANNQIDLRIRRNTNNH